MNNAASITRSLMLELRVAFTFVLREACLNDPLVIVVRVGSEGTSIPISCLILLIRSSLSSFSGSQ